MVKKIVKKVYLLYLQKRWKIKAGGGTLLANAFFKDYKNYSPIKTFIIHRRGFTVPDWTFLNLDKDNYREYLSNIKYCGMHPINGSFSAWIDDKLTLKYLCSGTELDVYMPEYYFQINEAGRILPLMDFKTDKSTATAEDVAKLLREKSELAIKLIAGSIGDGFYKAEYKSGEFLLNGTVFSEADFCKRIEDLRNYLIIEYLHPHEELARFCPYTVNCIRYLLGRINGHMVMLRGFIRFGTKTSGFVENYNAGGALCYLDDNGHFSGGNVIDNKTGKNTVISKHPDSGEELTGQIPFWSEIVEVGRKLDHHFPQMDYLGIDFVITSKNQVKVLEINSLSSLDALQLDGSILNTPSGRFYKERM